MADALCELLAVRALTLDALMVDPFYLDLGMTQSVHAAGRVAQVCSGLLFGHNPEVTLPNDTRETMVALRARLYASFFGLMPARERATEFIRKLDGSAFEMP
jgi:hypothetical protein